MKVKNGRAETYFKGLRLPPGQHFLIIGEPAHVCAYNTQKKHYSDEVALGIFNRILYAKKKENKRFFANSNFKYIYVDI